MLLFTVTYKCSRIQSKPRAKQLRDKGLAEGHSCGFLVVCGFEITLTYRFPKVEALVY